MKHEINAIIREDLGDHNDMVYIVSIESVPQYVKEVIERDLDKM